MFRQYFYHLKRLTFYMRRFVKQIVNQWTQIDRHPRRSLVLMRPASYVHHPSLHYKSYFCTPAFSPSDMALAVILTRAQCRQKTSRMPLNYFAGCASCLTMFSFTVKVVVSFNCYYPHKFTKNTRVSSRDYRTP